MNRTEAAALLNLDPSASSEEARAAYEDLFNEHQLRLTNAPTATLRTRYRERLRELDEAREIFSELPGSGGDSDLPASQPSFPGTPVTAAKQGPATVTRPSPPEPKTAGRRAWLRPLLGASALVIIALALVYPRSSDSRASDLRNSSRLELALVAEDSASHAGPPLHVYGDSTRTLGIERDLTAPGDIDYIGEEPDDVGRPSIQIELSDAAAARLNGANILGRDLALVLDGRTVLASARVSSGIGTRIQMTGNFTTDEVRRLINAISLAPGAR